MCADADAGKCDLIPEAQAWLRATNEEMAGGHCFGFSVAADLLWQQKVDVTNFGAADTTGLSIVRNQALHRFSCWLSPACLIRDSSLYLRGTRAAPPSTFIFGERTILVGTAVSFLL